MGDAFSTGESGDLSKRLVDAIIRDFPEDHPETRAETRPIHTVGIGVSGYFQPSDVARSYCVAEQFRGDRVPVTVRFSNGSGYRIQRDNAIDARGMATKFHLAEGREADLVMMTLPTFFVQTPDQFFDFTKAAIPQPARRPTWLRDIVDKLKMLVPAPDPDPNGLSSGPGTIDYASGHPFAAFSVITLGTQQPPTSYVRANYHAVHTFRATGADGVVRFVRLAWDPVAGVRPIDPDDAAHLKPNYLHTELRKRLDRESGRFTPGRFTLRMQIAGQGDVIDDPTVIWDDSQTRVTMGELVLTEVLADQDAGCERLSFNPCRVVPGLGLSDDPILLVRRGAYEESCRRRNGTGCPIGGHQT